MRKRVLGNTLWVEKYRPQTLDAYVSSPEVLQLFERYIAEQQIDNLLLWGAPGTGKTSAAKLLSSLIECDSLYINASIDNGIDTIRDKVNGFASTMGFNDKKIIILDEMDALTFQSLGALKPILEKYSAGTRFILTSNHPDKIPAALRSRCTELEFDGAPKPLIAQILSNILEKEEVAYELEDLKELINTHYPDIRKTIRDAQRYTVDRVLTLPGSLSATNSDYEYILQEAISNTSASWGNIRQYIADKNIKNFEPIYSYIYKHIEKFKTGRIPQIIVSVAEAQYQSAFVVDKEITFMACIANISK